MPVSMAGAPSGGPEARRARSLFPKEHGAYAQLIAPLVVALGGGAPSLSAVLLSVAACLVFIGHEPLLVLLGQRGRRAKEADGPRAVRLVLWLGLGAAASGLCGLALAPRLPVWSVAAPAVLVALTAALVAARRERSAIGESVVAVALTSAALPVGVASGLVDRVVLAVAAAWAIGFVVATLAVRLVLAVRRKPGMAVSPAWRALALLPVSVGAAVWGDLLLRACLPLLVLSAAALAAVPPARHVRTLGWGLAVATIATVIWLCLALRAG